MVTTSRSSSLNLEDEVERLELEVRLYKRLKLTSIERRLNELLDQLDDPANPQTKGQQIRERLTIVAVTVALTALSQGRFELPLAFHQGAKQEQVSPKFSSSSAPSLGQLESTSAKPVPKLETKPQLNSVPSLASSSAPSLGQLESTSAKPAKPEAKPQLRNLEEAQALFLSHKSIGPKAICEAEGNCSKGQKTRIYYGHTDPGNFARNYGWCSDQSKGGGTPEGGDRYCLQRTQERLPKIWGDFQSAGFFPSREEFINAVDLYNQAAPSVSRQFPYKLKEFKEKGQTGIEAIANSRAASFYFNGRNTAGGLLGICRREGRGLSDWDCVLGDQMRRAKAINSVINGFKPSVLDKTRQIIGTWSPEFQEDPKAGDLIAGYAVTSPRGMRMSPTAGVPKFHQGVDLGTPIGTPIRAIADGFLQCEWWPDAGIVGLFTSEQFPGLRFDLLHLSKCVGDQGSKVPVKAGEIIGWTGTADTGPHLHLAIKSESGKFLRVRAGWLYWFIAGKNPSQK